MTMVIMTIMILSHAAFQLIIREKVKLHNAPSTYL